MVLFKCHGNLQVMLLIKSHCTVYKSWYYLKVMVLIKSHGTV